VNDDLWIAIFTILGIELLSVQRVLESPEETGSERVSNIKENSSPGVLGFDPLGLSPKDPVKFNSMRTKELNNGRLAMIATAGLIAQELATGFKAGGFIAQFY